MNNLPPKHQTLLFSATMPKVRGLSAACRKLSSNGGALMGRCNDTWRRVQRGSHSQCPNRGRALLT